MGPSGRWPVGWTVRRLEEPEPPEGRDESFEGPGLRRRAKRLFGPLTDDVERSASVELTRDEMLGLPEAIEPPRHRILQDDRALLKTDDEIASELGLRGRRQCAHG